jgi:DedD protein
MSEERKKLLWISVSACVFGLVLIGAGFFLFSPKAGGAAAPATIGNSAAPKAQFPQEFFSAPLPVPVPSNNESTRTVGPDGTEYVVYGQEIDQGQGAPAAGARNATTAAPSQVPAGTTSRSPASASGAAAGTADPAKEPAAAAKATSSALPKAAPPKAAAPKSAAAQSAKAVKPSAAAQKPKSGDYWIQAAAFTSRGRADDLKQGLSDKGIASFISVKDIVGKSWYRVRVGPYATKAEAEGWLGRLKALPQCAEAYVSKGN